MALFFLFVWSVFSVVLCFVVVELLGSVACVLSVAGFACDRGQIGRGK